MIKNPCSEEVEYGLLYFLEKTGEEFHITDTIGTIILKEPGNYNLLTSLHGINEIVEIKEGVNKDTLYTQKIVECLEPVSHPSFIGYCCCDEKCNGIQKDYYNNGILRLEGEFENGLPLGEIKLYYPNGKIQEIRIYNKNGFLRRKIEYDLNGNKI